MAGQKNTDQKIIEIPDFFNENGKSMLNVSWKRHFCEFKPKNAPEIAWSAFSTFLRLGV